MDERTKNKRCLVAVGLLLLLLFLNMRGIERHQETEATNIMLQNPEVPASLALTTFALGPLRGLIVDGLWWRMIQHQGSGNSFETMQLTEWITALQPRFAQVWAYHGWNLSYNVAYEFAAPDDRWRWIQRGIQMLRDRGLQYNPGNRIIQDELATIFLDRIGSTGDPGHEIFKRNLALEMMVYLEHGNRQELTTLVEALDSAGQLYADPAVASLINAARELQLDLTSPAAVFAVNRWQKSDVAQRLSAGPHEAAWRRLLLHARAVKLQADLRLDPRQMLLLDTEYGPFDWRQPQAQAVYWAAREGGSFTEYVQRGYRQSTIIRQAMEQSFRNGNMLYDPATGFFMTTNNIQIVGRIHDFYDQMMDSQEYTEVVDRLHREFLEQAIPILYSYSQREAAKILFGHYKKDYLPAGSNIDYETFVMENMHRVLTSETYADNRGMINAALFQAYFWLAAAHGEQARGYLRLARMVWERHQKRFAAAPERLLPAFEILQEGARALILNSSLAPELKRKLQTSSPGLAETLGPDVPPEPVYVGAHGDQGHGQKPGGRK